jgi:hypothetical protein
MDRLKKLESAVLSLGAHVATDDEEVLPNEETTDATRDGDIEAVAVTEGDKVDKDEDPEKTLHRKVRELHELKRQLKELHGHRPHGKKPHNTGLEDRFGRLVVGDGKSRYINPSFWASLSNQVSNLSRNRVISANLFFRSKIFAVY